MSCSGQDMKEDRRQETGAFDESYEYVPQITRFSYVHTKPSKYGIAQVKIHFRVGKCLNM